MYEYSYDDYRDSRNYVDFDLRALCLQPETAALLESVSLRQWREGQVELEFREQGREPCSVTLHEAQFAALTELIIQRNLFKRIKKGSSY